VWPIVSAKIEGIKFTIIGSKPTPEINNLQSESIEVMGFVSEHELKNIYTKVRMAVIPMRYGAGVKGKTVEAMYNGIPVVSTTIGLEGMPRIFEIMKPFDDAEAFANEIISVYNNHDRLIEMSLKETDYVNNYFTWISAGDKIKQLLSIA
jgi:glycosyltransferase involved in cell wall biosynthesis